MNAVTFAYTLACRHKRRTCTHKRRPLALARKIGVNNVILVVSSEYSFQVNEDGNRHVSTNGGTVGLCLALQGRNGLRLRGWLDNQHRQVPSIKAAFGRSRVIIGLC